MNILLATLELGFCGISSYVVNLAKGLQQRGCKVIVCSEKGPRQQILDKLNIQTYCIPIHSLVCASSDTEKKASLLACIYYLKKILKEKNVHIVHANTRFLQDCCFFAGQETKSIMVTTSHGLCPAYRNTGYPYRYGRKIIAVSEGVKEHLKSDYHIPIQDIKTIYNGVDTAVFAVRSVTKQQLTMKDCLGIDRQHKVIGVLSRLCSDKGIDLLIKAFPIVYSVYPKACFLLAGAGSSIYRNKFRAVFPKTLNSNVIFLEASGKPEQVLGVMDIFVFPARQEEGLPFSVLEAMATGLPIVITRASGSIARIIAENEAGLVSADNPAALADSIISLLRRDDLAKKIGQRARALACRKFSLETMVDKTVALYRELLNGRN